MELKWKEQVKIAENVKLALAEVEDNYRVSSVFYGLRHSVPGTSANMLAISFTNLIGSFNIDNWNCIFVYK